VAAESGGDETFWRWSIIVAGAVIIASVSAILFVGKASSQDTAASVPSTTPSSGLHVVPGTATPTTEPTGTIPKVKIKAATIPSVTPSKSKAQAAQPAFAQLPFTFATPAAPVTSPTVPPASTVTPPVVTPPVVTPPVVTPPVVPPPVVTPPVDPPPVVTLPVVTPPDTTPGTTPPVSNPPI
jgi:hypothetical protein